jgi:hypothetical protein
MGKLILDQFDDDAKGTSISKISSNPTFETKEELLEHVWRLLEKSGTRMSDGETVYCATNLPKIETFRQLNVSTDEVEGFIRSKVTARKLIVPPIVPPIENKFTAGVTIMVVTE